MIWWLRFREFISWLERRSHRVLVRTMLGTFLLVCAIWIDRDDVRKVFLGTGTTLLAYSWGKHQQDQGKRRVDPTTGKQLRQPTLRLSAEEAERIQKLLRK